MVRSNGLRRALRLGAEFHGRIAGLGNALFRQIAAYEFRTYTASREHQNAVADIRQLLSVRTGANDRHAFARGVADRRGNLLARSRHRRPVLARREATGWDCGSSSARREPSGHCRPTGPKLQVGIVGPHLVDRGQIARLAGHGAVVDAAAAEEPIDVGQEELSMIGRLATPLAPCLSPGRSANPRAIARRGLARRQFNRFFFRFQDDRAGAARARAESEVWNFVVA